MKETIKSVKSMLSKLNIPINYHSFKSPPSLPYGVFLVADRHDLNADGINYLKTFIIDLEIYTSNDYFDFELQNKIEELLEDNNLYYQVLHEEVPDTRMNQMLYTFQVVKGELKQYE